MSVERRHANRQLESCVACGRVSHDWSLVEYRQDGQILVAALLCRACTSDTGDAVRSTVRRRVLA